MKRREDREKSRQINARKKERQGRRHTEKRIKHGKGNHADATQLSERDGLHADNERERERGKLKESKERLEDTRKGKRGQTQLRAASSASFSSIRLYLELFASPPTLGSTNSSPRSMSASLPLSLRPSILPAGEHIEGTNHGLVSRPPHRITGTRCGYGCSVSTLHGRARTLSPDPLVFPPGEGERIMILSLLSTHTERSTLDE